MSKELRGEALTEHWREKAKQFERERDAALAESESSRRLSDDERARLHQLRKEIDDGVQADVLTHVWSKWLPVLDALAARDTCPDCADEPPLGEVGEAVAEAYNSDYYHDLAKRLERERDEARAEADQLRPYAAIGHSVRELDSFVKAAGREANLQWTLRSCWNTPEGTYGAKIAQAGSMFYPDRRIGESDGIDSIPGAISEVLEECSKEES